MATGLIVKGLAMPEMKMEIDIEAVIPQPLHTSACVSSIRVIGLIRPLIEIHVW